MNTQRNVGIVAFGFGEPSSANPNPNIGALASDIAKKTNAVSTFTDRDVSPHLLHGKTMLEEIDAARIPTTYRLAVLAAVGAKKDNLDELYVVAAPCHMWRCLRDLRWATCDCGITIKLTPRPIEGYQYDPAAATSFTRAAWRWWPFEIAYRTASGMFPEWYKRTRA